jgi:hypothetical protein
MGVDEPPNCPDCSSPMVRRRAARGPRAGREFWGCSRFPACKGIVNIDAQKVSMPDGGSAEPPAEADLSSPDLVGAAVPVARVQWSDVSNRRDGWITDYVPCGGSLRAWSKELRDAARRDLDTAWFAWPLFPDAYQPADESTARVLGMMRKIILRGSLPPLIPAAEQLVLERLGIHVKEPLPGEIVRRPVVSLRAEHYEQGQRWRTAAELDALAHDSDEEEHLLQRILDARPLIAHDLIIQAPLDGLLRAHGKKTEGQRRVDLLSARSRTVVELDGAHHASSPTVDSARDRELAAVGYTTTRIPTSTADAAEAALVEEAGD